MGSISLRTRIAILRRDAYRCAYCGRTSEEVRLEVDHVVAKARGGTNDPENLITACRDCNNGKSASVGELPEQLVRRRPQIKWIPVRGEPGQPNPNRCDTERHPGPWVQVRYGPQENPGQDLALVCQTCTSVVAWRPFAAALA